MTTESTIPPWPKGYPRQSTLTGVSQVTRPSTVEEAAPSGVQDGFDPAAKASAQQLLARRLESEPVLRVKLSVLGALQAHRNELVHSLAGANAELAAWRKEHGGFDSMQRLGAAGGKMIQNLLGGNLKVWEGAGEKATDAETLERAPIRDRVGSLTHRIKEVDRAVRALAAGERLPTSSDYKIRELASALQGRPLGPAEAMRERLGWLSFCEKHRHAEDGAEAYVAALEPYLQLRTSSGESIQSLADGKASPTGLVNQLILLGLVENEGQLVTNAAELEEVLGALEDLLEKAPSHPKLAAIAQALKPEALDAERERLNRLAEDPALKPLRTHADAAQSTFDALRDQDKKGLIGRTLEAVGRILDSPETWAMAATGALVSGTGARLLFGGIGKTSDLILARRAHSLTRSLVGKYAAGTLVDAGIFHAAVNGFNVLRGKSERATWTPLDFAKTALLFQVLGAVGINAAGRQVAPTAVGKGAQKARFFAEEAGALTLLGASEALVRQGNLSGAMDLLEENFQFLLAMRLVGGFQRLTQHPQGEAQMRELQRLEGEAAAANLACRDAHELTPANVEAAHKAFRQYGERFNAAVTSLHERGIVKRAPDARPVIRSRGMEQLEATADGIKRRLLKRQDGGEIARTTAQALDTVVEARRTGRDLTETELRQALDPLVKNLRGTELGQLRDAVRSATADAGEVVRQERYLFDGLESHVRDLHEILTGSVRKARSLEECAAARAELNSAEVRISFEKTELTKGRSIQGGDAQAKELARLTELEAKLAARRLAVNEMEKVLRETPVGEKDTIEHFQASVTKSVQEQMAALTKAGQPVPETLSAKLASLDVVVQLAKSNQSLPPEQLAHIHNTLLIDLTPGQLTALRDALKQAQIRRGEFVQLSTGLFGVPGRLSEVSSLLLGLSREAVTPKQAREARERVETELRDARARLANRSGLQAELGPRIQRLRQRREELAAEEQALADGLKLNALPAAPRDLRSARDELAKVKRLIGACEGRLSEQLGRFGGDPSKLPPAEKKQRAQWLAERAGFERAASTLGVLIPELKNVQRRSRWDQTSLMATIGPGAAIPGLVAATADVGYKMGARDFHTGKRSHELVSSQLLRSAVGGPGYLYSKSNRGLNAGLTLPFAGIGTHPVLGVTAFIFVPGVFTLTIGDKGAISLMIAVPSPIPGAFVGVSFAVVNPALASITSPAFKLVFGGMDAASHYGRKLAPYLSPEARSSLRALTGVRSRGDAESRALLNQQLLPMLEDLRAKALRFRGMERASAEGRQATIDDLLLAAQTESARARDARLRTELREGLGRMASRSLPS